MSSVPIVDRIRIIPRPDDFLDRNVGASGEVFFNRATNSLRVYSGKDRAGFEIARADLDNISNIDFASKATAAGVANSLPITYMPDTENNLDWVIGTYDFGNNILKYANAVQLESELANYSAATYHGMTLHVHETGALYFAHAGEWRKLLIDTSYGDPISAGYTNPLGAVAYSSSYDDLIDTPDIPLDINDLTDSSNLIPDTLLDLEITDGTTGQVLTTDGAGNFIFADASAGAENAFTAVVSDDGTFTSESNQTLTIIGGINIATEVVTDSEQLTINLESFPIGFLSNVSTASPTSGQVLKWDGSQWAPGTDVAEGGVGLDADTLDGFESAYYLDYNNFTNTPTTVTLTDLSVGNELAASGDGAISYDNNTGVFRYTPPDLSNYLTSVAFSDLTSTPTTLSGYGITDAPSNLTDLGIADGSSGQVLTTDGAGNFSFSTVSSGGTGIQLTDLSIGTEGTASGDGSLAYDNTTGVFTYTPPIIPTGLTDLGITDGSDGQVLTTNGSGTFTFTTVSGGASDFDALGDASTAGLTIDKTYEPAIAMLRVDNVGTGSYNFPSHYTGENPNIYAISGTTIAFDLDGIPGHPFEIQTPTGDPYNTGLVHISTTGIVSTGAGAQGKDSGTLYWRIPESISGNYRYQCQSHASMVGAITLKRLSII